SKNYGNYQNDEVTALVEELHQTFDKEKRGELAIQLQQKILDDCSFFFIAHLNMGIVTKSNVSGMAAHPCDYYEITAELDIQ
ncbi:MAG: ABC transporter substrate-binding protein, partial [Lachnospiraceae bacterium]|nr:ABC transporter substrate-binding protein [Lachnospiraceae bacterium]